MAISYVDSGANNGSLSFSVSVSGVEDDDVLIAVCQNYAPSPTYCTITGFTQIASENASGYNYQNILWHRASSDTGSYTVNCGSGGIGVAAIGAFRGVTNSDPPYNTYSDVADNVDDDNITVGGCTPTSSPTLLVVGGYFYQDGTTSTNTPPGWDEREDYAGGSGSDRIFMATKAYTGTSGTGDVDFGGSPSINGTEKHGFMVVLTSATTAPVLDADQHLTHIDITWT